jgi:DNA (cytosine-5)-methyltransferase 1
MKNIITMSDNISNNMNNKIRVVSLFSGIGFQELSLDRLNIDYELVNYCEYDRRTSRLFSILHGVDEDKNLDDITQLDIDSYDEKDIDLVVSTFPCQSFSIQGRGEGFEDEIRGGLLDISLRFIKRVYPKYIIFENVKNILCKKFDFINKISPILNDMGYDFYYDVLNSVDFSIPQNRQRMFMVCIRKDLNINSFTFPSKIPLTRCVEDFIDTQIEDRVYNRDMERFLESDEFHREYTSNIGIVKLFDGTNQGFFESGFSSHRVLSIQGVAPCFTTTNDQHYYEISGKLTPRERYLLMGMKDDEVDRIINLESPSLHNKITGNGVVVNVMTEILRQLFQLN